MIDFMRASSPSFGVRRAFSTADFSAAAKDEHIGIPVRRVPREPLHDDGLDARIDGRALPRLAERHRRLREELGEELALRTAEIRQARREQVVRDRRETVLVGGHGDELTRERFRRDVHQGADEEAGAREPLLRRLVGLRRDAEVQQFHLLDHRIVHHVLGLQIAVDESREMHRVHGIGDLADDERGLFGRERDVPLRVLLEELAGGPLDGDEVHSGARFADLDRLHDVRMQDLGAVGRFAQETRDRGAVVAQLLAQDLHGDGPVL